MTRSRVVLKPQERQTLRIKFTDAMMSPAATVSQVAKQLASDFGVSVGTVYDLTKDMRNTRKVTRPTAHTSRWRVSYDERVVTYRSQEVTVRAETFEDAVKQVKAKGDIRITGVMLEGGASK